MGSKPSGTQSQTTQTDLPEWLRPYGARLVRRAQTLSQRPYQAYGDDRVIGMNEDQLGALGMIRNRAMDGSQVTDATRSSIYDTLSGKYLDSNPYIDRAIAKSQGEAIDTYQNVLKPGLDARAVRARAFGGSGYEGALGDMQGDLLDRIGDIGITQRAQLYDAERQRQLAAAQYAPMMQGLDYADAQMLLGAGGMQQQDDQAQATADYEDWLAKRQYPYQQLDVLGAGLSGALGGGAGQTIQTGPNPYQSNPMATMLGGGMLGYGAMSALGSSSMLPLAAGPWGAAAGAGLGLLGSRMGWF